MEYLEYEIRTVKRIAQVFVNPPPGHPVSLLEDKITQMAKVLREQEAALSSLKEQLFVEMCRELFVRYPDLKSFGWSQHDEYNDEDYVLRVRIDYDDLTVNDVYYVDTYDYVFDEVAKKGKEVALAEHESIIPLYKILAAFLGEIGEEKLVDIFGEHASVVVGHGFVEVEQVYE